MPYAKHPIGKIRYKTIGNMNTDISIIFYTFLADQFGVLSRFKILFD